MSEWKPYGPVPAKFENCGYYYNIPALRLITDQRVRAEDAHRNGQDVQMSEWGADEWADLVSDLRAKIMDERKRNLAQRAALSGRNREIEDEVRRALKSVRKKLKKLSDVVGSDEGEFGAKE
jgi:hypothetical protein